MAKEKKYTAGTLQKAVEAYFRSISRHVTIRETYSTGEKDKDGHMILAERDVLNDDGEPIRRLEYLVPPTVGGLCDFLRIHRSTWAEYAQDEKLEPICRMAKERMLRWNEEQLLTRSGKDVKGIQFNLEANYDYRGKMDISVHSGVEEFLRGLGGAQEF